MQLVVELVRPAGAEAEFSSTPAKSPSMDSVRANGVLQLDGKASYVELPSDTFTGLPEATVECWVRWETLQQTVAHAPVGSLTFLISEGQGAFSGCSRPLRGI